MHPPVVFLAMARHDIRRDISRLITFDAFGTLFTPREPIAKQYSDVARQLGLSGFTESALQSSFHTGMQTHHGMPAANRLIVDLATTAAFKNESRRHPNYGKASGMLANQWWANVGLPP